MRPSYLTRIWDSIADRGRILLQHGVGRTPDLRGLCRDLLSERGEASGTAMAREIVDAYRAMSETERVKFFTFLATDLSPDGAAVMEAAGTYRAAPNPDTLATLLAAVEPPRSRQQA